VSSAGPRHQGVPQLRACTSTTGTAHAIYPTEYTAFASPSGFATKLHKVNQGKKGKVKAKGDLAFLNTWTYKMGHSVLTPFGRQQLFDLEVGMRLKYGFPLESFSDPESPIAPRLPIIRARERHEFSTGLFWVAASDCRGEGGEQYAGSV